MVDRGVDALAKDQHSLSQTRHVTLSGGVQRHTSSRSQAPYKEQGQENQQAHDPVKIMTTVLQTNLNSLKRLCLTLNCDKAADMQLSLCQAAVSLPYSYQHSNKQQPSISQHHSY